MSPAIDKDHSKFLPIIFVKRQVKWLALKGAEFAMPSAIVEIRSIPGNVVAWGADDKEATERILEALNVQFVASDSKEEWFQSAFKAMTSADRAEAVALANHIYWAAHNIINADGTRGDALPADLEAAWAAWSKAIKGCDARTMTLLRAAFEAGADAAHASLKK